MIFTDRQSLYPNRYKVTKTDGSAYYVTLERADEPTVLGTPLNAETLNAWAAEIAAIVEDKTPAMMPGVEYKTTGLHNNKPVYIKLVDLGALPNTNMVTVSHGCVYTEVVSFEVYAKNTESTVNQMFPFVTNEGVVTAKAYISRAGLTIHTFSDLSKYTAKMIVRYTKD